MDTRICGLCAVKRETSVVLPVPDAAEMMNTLPLAVVILFTFDYTIKHNYAIVFRLPELWAWGVDRQPEIQFVQQKPHDNWTLCVFAFQAAFYDG